MQRCDHVFGVRVRRPRDLFTFFFCYQQNITTRTDRASVRSSVSVYRVRNSSRPYQIDM